MKTLSHSFFQEARALFRNFLTDATRTLKSLSSHLGPCVDKARTYFEALDQSKKVIVFIFAQCSSSIIAVILSPGLHIAVINLLWRTVSDFNYCSCVSFVSRYLLLFL